MFNYTSSVWQELRDFVWIRSGGKCEVPGCLKPSGETHHVHSAIGSPELAFDPATLVALCEDHHRFFHERLRQMGCKVISPRLVQRQTALDLPAPEG